MKIYDPSISRREALKLKSFVENASATCTPIATGGDDNEDHATCKCGSFGRFLGQLESYAEGKPMKDVLMSAVSDYAPGRGYYDLNTVIEQAPDLFLIGDGRKLAAARTDTGRGNAIVTAWDDMHMLGKVFRASVGSMCKGNVAAAEEIIRRIETERAIVTPAQAAAVESGVDFELI